MSNRIRRKMSLILLSLFFSAFPAGCSPVSPADARPHDTASPPPTAAASPSPTPAPTPLFVPGDGLPNGDTAQAGFDADALAAVGDMIRDEVAEGFPGAVLLVAREGRVVFHEAYGYARKWNGGEFMANPQPMAGDTLFDLASLTKFFAASLAVMKLCDQGLVNLNDPVSRYLDGFGEGDRAAITIGMLMNHSAGLPSSYCFYRPGTADDGTDTYSLDRTRTTALLSHVPLVYPPGTDHLYSDIGYMVLGAVIESITGTPLDDYVSREIYRPLGLARVTFNPLDHGFTAEQTAATETMGNTRGGTVDFPGVRTGTLQGQVHDETAWYCMGGVSGHAGLFADAPSLAVLCQMLLDGGSRDGTQILSENTVSRFLAVPGDTRYGLGFFSARDYFGDYASQNAICMTGWTGTAMVVDPERSLIIILLTNKRHSPCVDGEFEGAAYETGRYKTVVAGVYGALNIQS